MNFKFLKNKFVLLQSGEFKTFKEPTNELYIPPMQYIIKRQIKEPESEPEAEPEPEAKPEAEVSTSNSPVLTDDKKKRAAALHALLHFSQSQPPPKPKPKDINAAANNVKLDWATITIDNVHSTFQNFMTSAVSTFTAGLKLDLGKDYASLDNLMKNIDLAIPIVRRGDKVELDSKNAQFVYFANKYPILLSAINVDDQHVTITAKDIEQIQKYPMIPIGAEIDKSESANLLDHIYIRRRVNASGPAAGLSIVIGIINGEAPLNWEISSTIDGNGAKEGGRWKTLIVSDASDIVNATFTSIINPASNILTGKVTDTITGLSFSAMMSGGGKIDADGARAVVSDIRRYARDLADRVASIQHLFKLPTGDSYNAKTAFPFDAEVKTILKSLVSDSADFIRSADVIEQQIVRFRESIVAETEDSDGALAIIDSAWDEVSNIRDLLKSIGTISFAPKPNTFFGGQKNILNPIPNTHSNIDILNPVEGPSRIPQASASPATTRKKVAPKIAEDTYTKLLRVVVDANLLKSGKYDQNLVNRDRFRSKILQIESASTGDN